MSRFVAIEERKNEGFDTVTREAFYSYRNTYINLEHACEVTPYPKDNKLLIIKMVNGMEYVASFGDAVSRDNFIKHWIEWDRRA